MPGRKHIASPRSSAGCIVISGPIFELVGLKSHHIGHEPWVGGGVRNRQMKPDGSSWSLRALLLRVVSSHRIKYDTRLSGKLTYSHGGPAAITVTKPEPIQTDKCYESQLLEETNPHRGKTLPPNPVLEAGRALADFEGTRSSGTVIHAYKFKRIVLPANSTHWWNFWEAASVGFPWLLSTLSSSYQPPWTITAISRTLCTRGKSWQQVRAAVKLQCAHFSSAPMARTTEWQGWQAELSSAISYMQRGRSSRDH